MQLQRDQLIEEQRQFDLENNTADIDDLNDKYEGASKVPLLNSYVKTVKTAVSKLGTKAAKLNYLKNLYEKGSISEANLKYFLNECGL